MAAIEAHAEGTLIRIRLQPRASRAEILGDERGRLKMRIPAPPVEGAANKAAIKYLAKALGVGKTSLRLLRGAKSREKDFLALGVPVEKVQAALLNRGGFCA